jgi:ubiquinone/menaquinone biosynthesis C-methylase UbiE
MAATRHATHNRANMFGLARHAKHYERWAGLLATPLYRRVVADVAAAQLPGGAVVLDVGTGPGRVPMMIAERCPQLSVSGIDLSPEMTARATAVAARRSRGHSVEFQVADVVALPFADQSMDLVVSSISLHHWDDPAAGLRDIIRVLRPGAQAWIYDIRPMVRRAAPMTAGLDADQRMEVPLIGSLPINPIGRLVLTRHSSADE